MKRMENKVVASGASKPVVELEGRDGNAFSIIAACRRAARDDGWSDAKINGVVEEMMSGDYDNLLSVAMKHFEVE